MRKGDWKIILGVLGIIALAALLAYALTGNSVALTFHPFSDSDNGQNYYVKGTTYGQYESQKSEDSCSSDNLRVIEWYIVEHNLTNGSIEQMKVDTSFNCPNGCGDGACIGNCKEEESTQCDGTNLQICSEGEWKFLRTCDKGCKSGACVVRESLWEWIANGGK